MDLQHLSLCAQATLTHLSQFLNHELHHWITIFCIIYHVFAMLPGCSKPFCALLNWFSPADAGARCLRL